MFAKLTEEELFNLEGKLWRARVALPHDEDINAASREVSAAYAAAVRARLSA